MAQLAVLVAGLLLIAESIASDVADRSSLQGFLSKYVSSGSDASKSSITPNLNRVKHGNALSASPVMTVNDKLVLHGSTQLRSSDSMEFTSTRGEPSIGTKDFHSPKISDREDKQAVQKLLSNESYNPISLSAIGIGLVSLMMMVGVRLRRGLQPAGGLGLDMPMNTVSALDDNVMEMKDQDPNIKVNSRRVGWGQLSSNTSRPQMLCYSLPPPDRWAQGGPPADLVTPKALSRFITQRAVQQQLYYFALTADPTSHDYLAEYLRPPPGDDEYRTRSPPLDEDYHGVDALPTLTSRDYLCRLLEEPDLEITVKKEMGIGGGHESRSFDSRTGTYIKRSVNPYLEKRYHEYTMDIRPRSICRQLFAIREQISGELVNDLRELPKKDGDLARARALYDEDQPSFDEVRLGDADGGRASPFRAATYELALQLCTAHAVESIIHASSDRNSRELERTWRAHKEGFYRHNNWTRGDAEKRSVTDAFISDLVLATRPSLDGERLESPADAVLFRRCAVASEWADALERIPDEHLAWNRWILESSALDTA